MLGTHHNQRLHLKQIVVTIIVIVAKLLSITTNNPIVIVAIIIHRWGTSHWQWWWLLKLSRVFVKVKVYAVIIVVIVVDRNRLWACVLMVGIECSHFIVVVDWAIIGVDVVLYAVAIAIVIVIETMLLHFVGRRYRRAHSIWGWCEPVALIIPFNHHLFLMWHNLLDLVHWWADAELVLRLQYMVAALWWWYSFY